MENTRYINLQTDLIRLIIESLFAFRDIRVLADATDIFLSSLSIRDSDTYVRTLGSG